MVNERDIFGPVSLLFRTPHLIHLPLLISLVAFCDLVRSSPTVRLVSCLLGFVFACMV
jgi:hypothetical protein